MKKSKLITCLGILLLGCMGMASCSVEEEISKVGVAGSVTLQLNSSLIDTRAEVAGNDAYNENLITDVYVLFYPAGETDMPAKAYRHVTMPANTKTTGTATITFPSAELMDVFPGNTTEAEVYAIANLPMTEEEFQTTILDANATSIEDLKKIQITADFENEVDATATPQASFVMDGQAEVTLNRTEMTVKGEIDLKRAASQIALFVTGITGTATDSEDVEWVPYPAGMEVIFHNGVKDATVDVGETYTVDAGSYVEYTRAFGDSQDTPVGADNKLAYAQELPFYSYSSDWSEDITKAAYMTLVVPWTPKKGGGERRNCYYMVPINLDGKKFERNTYYKIMIEVGILGSFLLDEPVVLEPSSYIILDWGKETFDVKLETFKYLVVDEIKKSIYNQEICEIAYSSSSKITVKVDKVTYPSYKNGFAEPQEESVFETTVTNDDKTFTLEHSLTYPIDNRVPYTFDLTVTNEDGMSEKVVITQYPSLYISIDDGDGGNAFINGYFGNIANPGPGFGSQNADGTYYYSYDFITNNQGAKNGEMQIETGAVRTGYGQIMYSPSAGGYINMGNTVNVYVTAFDKDTYTYSDGTRNWEYMIGDPRVPGEYTTDDFNPYLTGLETASPYKRITDAWDDDENVSEIQVSTKKGNIIAPAFKIASSWGRHGGQGVVYEDAQKRCATYQEAGYPAGRWRMPTEAEIAFTIDLQRKELLPMLFNISAGSTTEYWASSERVCLTGVFGAPAKSSGRSPVGEEYVRCVYDIWYWGEEPYSEAPYNQYIPNAPKK